MDKSSQSGVVLLEALIAILIFSFGILAIVGLQAAMIKNTSDAKYRAEATFIVQQRIGSIWIDPENVNDYVEASTDISNLLPNGKRTVTVQNIAGDPDRVNVTITWQPPGQENINQYTSSARINGAL